MVGPVPGGELPDSEVKVSAWTVLALNDELAELVADAQSAFDAVKRRAPDLFRNAGAAPSSKRSRRR